LHCIAKNYSDREIAIELVVAVRTVKHHVHNILRKFKVKHRWQAAQLARENRWLEPTSS
jgi:DNA-binding NarL/FixJ family response regulator